MQTACRSCGSVPTIKAHIIPQAAFAGIRRRGPDTKIVAVRNDRAMVAQNPNGVFDPSILCSGCDSKIGALDKWFVENIDAVHQAGAFAKPYQVVSFELHAIVAIKFAASVIYRASLSTRNEFAGISLGPYEPVAANIIFGGMETVDRQPLVIMSLLKSDEVDTRQFAFYPVRCGGSNGPYFTFVISGVQMLVKFGGARPGLDGEPEITEKLRLKLDRPVFVVVYPFEDSGEADFMKSIRSKTAR